MAVCSFKRLIHYLIRKKTNVYYYIVLTGTVVSDEDKQAQVDYLLTYVCRLPIKVGSVIYRNSTFTDFNKFIFELGNGQKIVTVRSRHCWVR